MIQKVQQVKKSKLKINYLIKCHHYKEVYHKIIVN